MDRSSGVVACKELQEQDELASAKPTTRADDCTSAAQREDTAPSTSQGKGGGLCQQCAIDTFRYKCPGCGLRTCSLACSKGHKESTGCTGKRRRTDYVALDVFNEKQLLADIGLLEEIQRENDAAVRKQLQPQRQTYGMRKLKNEACRRHVNLEIMSPGMHKRVANDTIYEWASRKLLWHVEWHFVGADFRIHDSRIPEERILGEVLHEHVRPQKRGSKDDKNMQQYEDQGVKGLTVLMRPARYQVSAPVYYKLDTSMSLASQLEHKTIVEYPMLLVLLPHEVAGYPLKSPAGKMSGTTAKALTSSGESEV